MPLTDNQVSALIGGGFAIVGTLLGIVATIIQSWKTARSRRKGAMSTLAYELRTNVEELHKWRAGEELPVRSSYLWEALRAEAPGLLDYPQIEAVAEFYYRLAQVYKSKIPSPKHVDNLIEKGNTALVRLGSRAIA